MNKNSDPNDISSIVANKIIYFTTQLIDSNVVLIQLNISHKLFF